MAPQLIDGLDGYERNTLEQELRKGLVIALQAVPALQSPAVAKALGVCTNPNFGAIFAAGFVEGFVEGFVAGARTWRDEFKAMLHLVGVGTVVGVAEFFVRPLVETDPEGLLPQSKEALETLNSLRTLKPVFLWLDAVGPEQAVATFRSLIPSAGEVAEMIGVIGRKWLLELCDLAPDAERMGAHCGHLFGRAALELIRADVEPFSFGLAGSLEAGPGPAGAEAP